MSVATAEPHVKTPPAPPKPPCLQSLGNWLDNQLAAQERIGLKHEAPIEELPPDEIAKLPPHLRGCRRPGPVTLYPINAELLNELRRDHQAALEMLAALREKWQPMLFATIK